MKQLFFLIFGGGPTMFITILLNGSQQLVQGIMDTLICCWSSMELTLLTCLTMHVFHILEHSRPVEAPWYSQCVVFNLSTQVIYNWAYHAQTSLILPVDDISLAIQFAHRHSTQVNFLDTKCDTALFPLT